MDQHNNDISQSNSQQIDISPPVKVKLPKIKNHRLKTLIIDLLVIILIAGSGLGTYYWQHSKVNSLNNQISNLKQQLASSQSSNNQPNVALSDALTYGKQPTGTTLQIDNGEVVVNSALYASYFGTYNNSGDNAVVDITITNNTDSTQSYDLSDFSVQVPGGQIFSASNTYTQTGDQIPTDTLAPSGSVTEDIFFGPIPSGDVAGNGYLIYTSPSTSNTTNAALVFKKPLN
ncbi:MAG: DUF4352 domain-containing protein [Candidatus Saccharimonadales bacterium]|jgi:hypothetical protein